MSVRGIRGANVAESDHPEAISVAVRELLIAILADNPSLDPADLASAVFTVTPDLCSAFPAEAARELSGWQAVPLLCAQEIPVGDSLPRCVRVLLHWNTDLPQEAIRHVYLGQAASLRPDWVGDVSSTASFGVV